jgi:hypothetical protein
MTPTRFTPETGWYAVPCIWSSPRESVAMTLLMTLFRVRHELRMWHDCGVHDWGGKELFWRIVASGACHSKFPLDKVV